MSEAEQNQAVGKRNVHKEPELEQSLRSILEIEIVLRLDPIAQLERDRFLALVQVTAGLPDAAGRYIRQLGA